MSDHAHIKTPIAQQLSGGMIGKAQDRAQLLGKGLPCHVVTVVSSGIVTVAFDIVGEWTLPQITMPVMGPEYIRYPIQVNDKGWAIPAATRLGGNSGLGPGTAGFGEAGNLGALMFMWMGNSGWSATDDPNAVVIYGPNGVIARTTDKAQKIVLNENGITIETSASMPITATPDGGTTSITMTPGLIVLKSAAIQSEQS